jgi:hypothetical protein
MLIGPKGTNLKNLEETSGCRIFVKGGKSLDHTNSMVSHQLFETEHGINGVSLNMPPPSDGVESDCHVLLIANCYEVLGKGNEVVRQVL